MPIVKKLLLCAAAVLSLGSTATAAVPAPAKPDMAKWQVKANSYNSIFDATPRQRAIRQINDLLEGKAQEPRGLRHAAPAETNYEPSEVMDNLDSFGDLDGPDGKLWYFTAHFEYEEIQQEAFVDRIMRKYRFEIFDENLKPVGSIEDQVVYAEDEVRVPRCGIAPVVTQHFFNTDDKYEISVCAAVNTTHYVNRYKSRVYSLGGEKKDGFDVPVYQYTESLVDVVDGGTDGRENYFMTYSTEGNDFQAPDGADEGEIMEKYYWENYMGNYTEMVTYRGARTGETGPQEVFRKRIRMAQLPGTMENTPMISYGRNGKAHFVLSYYEQPFYNEYHSFTEDMTQREGNNLVIEVYQESADGNSFALVQTTKVPVVINTDYAGSIASYYGVGDFNYKKDIDYSLGTDGKAGFFITRWDYVPSGDKYVPSYFTYNDAGERLKTVYEYADSHTPMADLPGCDPQELFVEQNPYTGEYTFVFKNMRTFKNDFKINSLYEIDEDSDPEQLTANLDRVAVGSTYKYAVEMRKPAYEEGEGEGLGNDIMRCMWLDSKGKFDRIDQINMGPDVAYAQMYIDSPVLDPAFWHSDSKQEYMILIKRGLSTLEKQEELIVGQARDADNPSGRNFLHLTPNENGVLSSINPVYGYGAPRLIVSYADKTDTGRSFYTMLSYALPLDNNVQGIADAVAKPAGQPFTVAGKTVSLAGEYIEVYNLQGVLVASGNDCVSLEGMPGGVYIARAGEKAAKIRI